MDGPLARGPWRVEPGAVTPGDGASSTLPGEFVFRSGEPRLLEVGATRTELAGAGLGLLAVSLLVFAPSHPTMVAAVVAAPVLAVAATAALVTRRPGTARHLLGGAILALLAATFPVIVALGSGGPSILRILVTVVLPVTLMVFAILRAIDAERSRRLAWGIRHQERLERDLELSQRHRSEPELA